MFASPLLFDRVGWRGVANATPNFMLWAGLPFFAGCIAFTFAAGGLPAVASRGVLMALVITGAILQVWGRRGRRLWHSNGATGGVAGKAGLGRGRLDWSWFRGAAASLRCTHMQHHARLVCLLSAAHPPPLFLLRPCLPGFLPRRQVLAVQARRGDGVHRAGRREPHQGQG